MIKVENVKKYFNKVKAVDGVSFAVEKGKTFGLVGESGSGKSTIARLIMGVLKPDSGSIAVNGSKNMVFQDPFSSLNPRMRIKDIVGESLFVRRVRGSKLKEQVESALSMVKLDARSAVNKYPHQFSGGQRQRIAIARALITRPEALILDEPVSNLDVSIQAGILNLLKDIQDEMHLTCVFITHDLRVAEFMSDYIGVMKDGRLVECASRDQIYSSPQNEYTRQLLDAIPKL